MNNYIDERFITYKRPIMRVNKEVCRKNGAPLGRKRQNTSILVKGMKSKIPAERISGFMKYFMTALGFTLPSVLINTYITKEQKKASRVANMLAINEMQDYRNFADYSRFKN